MPSPAARADRVRPLDPIAEPLHRDALHLLRLLRREDAATGVSAARLSALSVLVFGGSCTLGTLAAAEQVSAPTMTRLAQELERDGFVRRRADPTDARATLLEATAAARRLLHRGRERRLAALSLALGRLSVMERRSLAQALAPLRSVSQALATTAPARGARLGRRRHD